MARRTCKPETVVLPIHFEDRSGAEFERLCFAYIFRMRKWTSADWYGQLGGDSGRDIWATAEDQLGRIDSTCFQCANYRSLRFSKVQQDIDKLVSGPNAVPDKFVLICGGKVSASIRDRIATYAKSKGIHSAEIWSGTEFEERLREETPSLIQRFVEGVLFPETAKKLKAFALGNTKINDEEILSLIAQCLDRPAFTTPFNMESSIPAFKKAITDTIEVLNTGVHRLRDGTVIRKIPSRHDVGNKRIQEVLTSIVSRLTDLRHQYDEFIKTRDIKPCRCNDPDCSVLMCSPKACRVMDDMRSEILELFRSVYPKFSVDSLAGGSWLATRRR